jgi:hypothetical protein
VALTVGNRDESAAWYASTLGFEEISAAIDGAWSFPRVSSTDKVCAELQDDGCAVLVR